MNQGDIDPGKLCRVEMGERDEGLGINRILLVGHGRGGAAAGKLDLSASLRHQRYVLAELAERTCHQRQPIGEVGDAVALAVPLRCVGEPEAFGERGADSQAFPAESVECAGSTAELDDTDRLAHSLEALEVSQERGAPALDPVGDGDRYRRLHARMRHQLTRTESAGEVAECGGQRGEPLLQEIDT